MKSTTLIFASRNAHKASEIQTRLPASVTLITLDALGFTGEIPEPFDTLTDNALAKAKQIFTTFHQPCFAEDSGLEIDVLHGRPGVHSAHYAGPQRDDEANIQKILLEMGSSPRRSARFQTVIAFCREDGSPVTFTGTVEGRIANEKSGAGGFGYDPVFIPQGFDQTFAELPVTIKLAISHRTRALEKFLGYLNDLYSL